MSVGGSIKHDVHKKRREALNPFFSKRSVTSLEPYIVQKVGDLQRCLEKHLEERTPVNLSDTYFAFANDVVSQYSFGNSNELLKDEVKASSLRENLSRLLLGIKFNQHFPWIIETLDLIPNVIGRHIVPPGAVDMLDFSTRIRREIQLVLNDKNDMSKGSKRSIFYELRDNKNLPPAEKTMDRLEQEATLLVMAGTESTAKSIAITHFHLLSNPQYMARLRAELATVRKDASWTELEALPYLSAVIAEGNRLSFGVTARVCRISPDDAIQYEQYTIPAGTPISMTTLCAHTDEHVFPDPWTFNPDRWLGPEGMERRKYQMAFNKGGRSCVGINLAHAETFLAIAAIANYKMELFETGIEDVEFRHDYQVAYPKLDSKGVRAMVLGRLEALEPYA